MGKRDARQTRTRELKPLLEDRGLTLEESELVKELESTIAALMGKMFVGGSTFGGASARA
jgi:hypothetical protein